MPITLNCPTCKRKLSVPDNAAGKNVKCPKCETVTRVPTEEQAVETIEAIDAEEQQAAAVSAQRTARPSSHESVEERPVRRAARPDELEEIEESPRKRPDDLEDLEEDEERRRAVDKKKKKGITIGAVLVGLLSAFITLLAFAAVATACWCWTRIVVDTDMAHRETLRNVNRICLYSACGLAVVGFLSSLYSRGLIRILALLFGIGGIAAAAGGMLLLTGIIEPNPFENYSKSLGSSAHKWSPEIGGTYFVQGDSDDEEVIAFRSERSWQTYQGLQTGGQPPGGRPGGRPGGDRPGGGPGGDRPGGRPGGGDMKKQMLEMLKQQNEAVVLEKGTKVTVTDTDPILKVKVVDGIYKDDVFFINGSFLHKPE